METNKTNKKTNKTNKKKMNHKRLAVILGISKNRLSNILAGRANVSVYTAARWKDLTGISVLSWISESPAVRTQAVKEYLDSINNVQV